MSFFLDPPALFLLGILLFIVKQEQVWKPNRTFWVGFLLAFVFLVVSPLLYLDIISWPLPSQSGSDWMFHTPQTGIQKADVSVALVIFMFILYPLWLVLGYIVVGNSPFHDQARHHPSFLDTHMCKAHSNRFL